MHPTITSVLALVGVVVATAAVYVATFNLSWLLDSREIRTALGK